jgi:hypothetical protein
MYGAAPPLDGVVIESNRLWSPSIVVGMAEITGADSAGSTVTVSPVEQAVADVWSVTLYEYVPADESL